MRADGDTEGYAIAGFTISLVGLVSISTAPAILLAAITSSDDEREVTNAVVGAVLALLVLPVLGMVFASIGKGRINRTSQPLRGDGLGDAAMVLGILSVVALLGWVAALLVTMNEEENDATVVETAPTQSESDDGPDGGEVGTPTLASDQLYLVGQEMSPGRWDAVAPAPTCEWVRLANVPENEDDLDVIEEGTATSVTIGAGDVSFMSWDCGSWQQ